MAQDIIGRAWIGVAIKDETAPGMQRLESGLRQRSQRMSGMGTGGFGAGRRGGRESGAFGGWNQIAFGIEDAVVSAQLNGFSGAVRAMSNNVTMMALAFGGLRAQMLATALVVGLQLAPAFLRLAGMADPVENMLKRMTAAAKVFRSSLEVRFDASQMGQRISDLKTADAALSHMDSLRQRSAKIEAVDRPVLADELDFLKQLRAGEHQTESLENIGQKLGEASAHYIAAAESDEQRLEIINREIAAREQLLKNLDAESNMLANERVETLRRYNELRVREQKEKAFKDLSGGVTGVLGELDKLIGPNEADKRAARERNRQLEQAFSDAGIDGSGVLASLADIDRLRMAKGKFNGLPDTLSQMSIAGAQQFATNKGTQNDPAVRHLQEIRDAARSTRDKLDELLEEIRTD